MNFRARKDSFDRRFNMFQKIFWVAFTIAALWVVACFFFVGFVFFQLITDPKGSAGFMGDVAAEFVKPVVNVVENE